MTTNALAKALALAQIGLPVFPCAATKRPTCPHGFKEAVREASAVRALWRAYPGTLIGVPTGATTGIFVLDVDSVKHPTAAEWLERQSPYLPDTRQHRTQSGGLHFLFKHRDGLRNSAGRLARGVDTRGDGGYVLWWPAVIANGHHRAPLADVPEWMATALNPPRPAQVWRSPAQMTDQDLNRKVDGILGAIAAAREGERNSLLNWGAYRIAELVKISLLPRDYAFDLATEAGRQAGLSIAEAKRTVQSAFRGLA
jgi:hypothetical protein